MRLLTIIVLLLVSAHALGQNGAESIMFLSECGSPVQFNDSAYRSMVIARSIPNNVEGLFQLHNQIEGQLNCPIDVWRVK